MTHELKTLNPYFDKVWDGSKTFELRSTFDRCFEVGDIVILREIMPAVTACAGEQYTGRRIRAVITYVLDSFPGLLCRTAVIFSFKVTKREKRFPKKEGSVPSSPINKKRKGFYLNPYPTDPPPFWR